MKSTYLQLRRLSLLPDRGRTVVPSWFEALIPATKTMSMDVPMKVSDSNPG